MLTVLDVAWVGAASIQDGVQVDLGQLKHVVVSADQQTTAIGPGARWFDVYSTLDPLGLTVPGGRVATVGVGGLITGGVLDTCVPLREACS